MHEQPVLIVYACHRQGHQPQLFIVHDVFLNDELDGPLEIALYSAALFSLTEGRAYSKKEYQAWLNKAGMTLVKVIPTLAHCGVMVFSK